MFLDIRNKIHIIGIGGIGMSAIAIILNKWGFAVQGSNAYENDNVLRLRQLGMKVFIGHDSCNVSDVDLVAYSSAIAQSNDELCAAREQGKLITSRAKLLALMLDNKEVVSITGTNGKTTSTAMIADMFYYALKDPLALIGGIMQSNQSNVVLGSGNIAIVEADESDGTFLELPSDFGVITNIANDHVDYYGSINDLYRAFSQFCLICANRGFVVINLQAWECIGKPCEGNIVTFCTYSMKADFYVEAIHINDRGGCDFTVVTKNRDKLFFSSPLIGQHNVSNALSAIAFALTMGIDYHMIYNAVDNFRGIYRRFTTIGEYFGCRVVDDYAHHPSAIKECIIAAQSLVLCGKGVVFAVIQPHRYSRVKSNFEEYIEVLQLPDYLFLLDNFAVNEPVEVGYRSLDLLNVLHDKGFKNASFISGLKDLVSQIHPKLKRGDLVLFIGAGDINSLSKNFVEYGMNASKAT